ncbi:MAG: hypothetical protein IH630_07380 [Thermoplasmata archaeon]|nr:hypothetical protein [Thermoplasmata archaeon]
MATSSEVDRAVQDAKRLLEDNGYDCTTTAADLRQWFEADTPFDENFGLDEVLRYPLLVVHELVEIENVKRMGLSLTKDVIVTNLEKIDDAHLIATEAELKIAIALRDVRHIRDRLENIRMWIEDDTVTPENKEKYRRMHSETQRVLESIP